MTEHVEIVAPGPLTTIQDLGRHGLAHYGVAPSGAADRGALRRANQIVGNPPGAAALEVTLGGLRLRCSGPVALGLAGAPCLVSVGGRTQQYDGRAMRLTPHDELRLATPKSGLRTYVAVRGGIEVPAVLGSRSTDLLSGLGPDVCRAGTWLPVGAVAATASHVERDQSPAPEPPPDVALGVVFGPRADWFTAGAHDVLTTTSWTVTPDSNRVGMRLRGRALERARTGELPTEGLVRGALQVTPDGWPTLLLADHPLTGGYPVIAVVVDADVDRAAQVRPGQQVRFVAAATAM